MKLAANEFKLVPAGENVPLRVTSVELKPKARPQNIVVTFKHENGGTCTSNYGLQYTKGSTEPELKEKSSFPFSCLARCCLGDIDDVSLSDDLPKFVDKLIECEVTHTEPNDKGYVYANVRKTKKLIVEEEVVADPLDDDEEDDL